MLPFPTKSDINKLQTMKSWNCLMLLLVHINPHHPYQLVIKHRLQQDISLTDRIDILVTNVTKLLEFVLLIRFFTYKHENYKQISGCAIWSPISATTADTVVEHSEEKTEISTSPHSSRRWFRYVDDYHSCLKKTQVNEFHNHLHSINTFTFHL